MQCSVLQNVLHCLHIWHCYSSLTKWHSLHPCCQLLSIPFDGENKPKVYCDDMKLGTTIFQIAKKKKKKRNKAVGGYRTLFLPILFCFVLFLVKSTDSLFTAFRFDYLICPWSHSFIFYHTVFSTELSIWATFFQFHMVIGKCANECIDT